MSTFIQTTLMLVVSNLFMPFAWYGHLKTLNHRAWDIAALLQLGSCPVRVSGAGAG